MSSILPVEVIADPGRVEAIHLFSTGGELAVVTGQSVVTFNVDGTTLGAGVHPFHALVEGSGGELYRTETEWIRLTPGL